MQDFNSFKKSLDSIYPQKTPQQEQLISEVALKQQADAYKKMLGGVSDLSTTGANEQMLANQGINLTEDNYNVDELFNQTSDGRYLPKFETYTPGRDNYDFFARNQTTGEKWLNGATQFGQTVINSVAGLGNLVYGTGAMIAEGEFAAFYDNDYMNWLDNISEERRLNNPIYKTYEEQEMGFGESMGTASFWADDFLQGTAFTAGMVASELVLRGLTGGVVSGAAFARGAVSRGSVLPKLDSLMPSVMSKARQAATQPIVNGMRNTLVNLNKAGQAENVMKGLNLARVMVTSAGYEAGFEARHFMRDMRKNYGEDFFNENGFAPTEEDKANFETELKDNANKLFAFNVAVVGTSNIVQFGGLLKAGLPKLNPNNFFNTKLFTPAIAAKNNLANQINTRVFGAGLVNNTSAAVATIGQKAARVGYTFGRNALMEGVVEEGLQAVGTRTAEALTKDSYSRHLTEQSLGIGEAFREGMKETYGTEEGRKEVYLGMLIGALTGSAMNLVESRSLADGDFRVLDQKAKGIEKELLKGGYSARVIAENLLYSNRVLAHASLEKKAEQNNDFLGGQIARAGYVFSQATRGLNLDYTEQIKAQTIAALESASDQEIAEKAGVDISQANEIRQQMIKEYNTEFDEVVNTFENASAMIGQALTKGEMQEFEAVVEEYVKQEYTPINAKKEAANVLKSALAYDMYMGRISHNHSQGMLDAFLNQIGNTYVSDKAKKAITIYDILKKGEFSKTMQFSKATKAAKQAQDEITQIEKEQRTVEGLIAQATAETSNRPALLKRLNDLTNKRNELTAKMSQLTDEINVILSSSKLQNRFGSEIAAPLVSADEIAELEKSIDATMETLQTLSPEKRLKAEKFLQEYEEATKAFKNYDKRISQIMDKRVGLKGKKALLPSFFSAKSPNQQTAELIRDLLETHYIKEKKQKEAFNEIENRESLPADVTTVSDLKGFLQDQPYLFEQYQGETEDILPTEQEITEFFELAQKQNLNEEEKARQEELTEKLFNWSLAEETPIGSIVQQEALRETEVTEAPAQELTEEDVDTMLEGEEEADPRPFNYLQVISHVFLKFFPKKNSYYFSHITPKGFLELVGQTENLKVKRGKKTEDITIDEVNKLKVGDILSFGNGFSFEISQGGNIKLTAKPNDFQSLGLKTRMTKSGYSYLYDTEGKPMKSDLDSVDTFSFDELMELESGETLIAKVDMSEEYNKNLSEADFENNIRIGFYNQAGNKVAMLKGLREGEVAPNMFLALRKLAKETAEARTGIVELGEATVETILLGAPMVELNKEFAIDENLIETKGTWDGSRLTLDDKDIKTKSVRKDFLKGINKNVPIVVFRKGKTLIAYPIKGGRVASNQANDFTEKDAALVIKINETLIKNGLKPAQIYFHSAEKNNIYESDGTPTQALQDALDQVNNIPTAEIDLANATININLEGQRILPPKISIDLDNITLYGNEVEFTPLEFPTPPTPNTKEQPDIEAKKAEIERRRQEMSNSKVEEIVNRGKSEKIYKPITKEDKKNVVDFDKLFVDITKAIENGTSNEKKEVNKLLKTYLKEVHPDKTQDKDKKLIAEIFSTAMINVGKKGDISKLKELYNQYKEINAKYDAELKTLEEQQNTQQNEKNVPEPTGQFEAVEVIEYTEAEKNNYKPNQQLKFNQGTFEAVRIVGDSDLISLIEIGSKILNNRKDGKKRFIDRQLQDRLEKTFGITAIEASEKAKQIAKDNRSQDNERIVKIGKNEKTNTESLLEGVQETGNENQGGQESQQLREEKVRENDVAFELVDINKIKQTIYYQNGKYGIKMRGKFVAEQEKNQNYFAFLERIADANNGVIENYDKDTMMQAFLTPEQRTNEAEEEIKKKCE